MSLEFLFIGLAAISAFTTLTTEGIKKLLDEAKRPYSPNLLAVIVTVVLTIGVSIAYIIMASIPVDAKVIVEVVAMVFLSFLCSTVGFDKIKQTILQLSGK